MNFRLHDEQTVYGLGNITWLPFDVSMSPRSCHHVSMSLCFHVSMCSSMCIVHLEPTPSTIGNRQESIRVQLALAVSGCKEKKLVSVLGGLLKNFKGPIKSESFKSLESPVSHVPSWAYINQSNLI
jgi:hypothetical protein